MKRSTLTLQPIHNSSADIIKCFHLGKPLSPDQLNLLNLHQQQLSNPNFDPILKYYLKSQKQQPPSFVLPYEEINRPAIDLLKKRLRMMLQQNPEHQAVITFTPEQFAQFKEYTLKELIFWHGNQLLTGSPFYPSAIPPMIYFQWGNEFGIVKYGVLAGEKMLKANILIHFEDMQDRDLDRCVADYSKRMEEQIKSQDKLLHNKQVIEPIHPPEWTLAKSYLIDHLPRPFHH